MGGYDDNVGKALVLIAAPTPVNTSCDADVSGEEDNDPGGIASDTSPEADELNLSGFDPPESHALVVAGPSAASSGSGDDNGPLQLLQLGSSAHSSDRDLDISSHLDLDLDLEHRDQYDASDDDRSFDFSTAFSSVFSSDTGYSTDDTRPRTNRDRQAAARIKRKIRRRDRAIAELKVNQEVLAEEAARSGRDKVAVAMWYQSLLTDVVKQRVSEAKAEASELRTERANLARDVEERDLWLKDLATERDGLREDAKKSKNLVRTYKSIIQKLAVKEEERVTELTEGHQAEVETLRRMLEEKDERIDELTSMAAASASAAAGASASASAGAVAVAVAAGSGDDAAPNDDSRYGGRGGGGYDYYCASSSSMGGDSSYLNRRLNLSSAPAVSIDEEEYTTDEGYGGRTTTTTTTDDDDDERGRDTSRDDFESSVSEGGGEYAGFADNSAMTSDDEWTADDPNGGMGAFPIVTAESPLARMRRSGHVTAEGLSTAVGDDAKDDDDVIGMMPPSEAMARMRTQRAQFDRMAASAGLRGEDFNLNLDLAAAATATANGEERQHLLAGADVPAAVVAVSPSSPPRHLQQQQQHAGSDTSEAQRAHVAAVAAAAASAVEEERREASLAVVMNNAPSPPSRPPLDHHREASLSRAASSSAEGGIDVSRGSLSSAGGGFLKPDASSRQLEMHQRYCDMISELQGRYLEKSRQLEECRAENDALRRRTDELGRERKGHMEELTAVQRRCTEMVTDLKASRARLCHELEEHLQLKDKEIEELSSANAAQAKLLQSTRQSADASGRQSARAEMEQMEEVRRLNEMYTTELAELRRGHRREMAALRRKETDAANELDRSKREAEELRRRVESTGAF